MDISLLTKDEYIKYLFEQKSLGNYFVIDGATEVDAVLFENGSQPDLYWYYGTFTTVLHKYGSEWRISIAGGTIPDFRIRPKAVSESQFFERLQEMQVPTSVIDNYKKQLNEPFPEDF